MSDTAPPDWFDNVPPADADDFRGAAGPQQSRGESRGQGSGGRSRRPSMTDEEVAAAARDFLGWLTSRETRAELELVLPDHVDVDVFITTAKSAVMNRPELLRADLRQSLLRAIERAAGQGLMPDGKQGALVARWDSELNRYAVAWQPMVWGITKLGRETGAIRTIRAVIVFNGETFRIVQGDEDRIEHEVDIDIAEEAYRAMNGGRDAHGNPLARPDDFFARVRAAYCVITATDGAVTKRWMTKERLMSLRDASKASKGPWASRWIDEMICKAVILFTSKWINLDPDSAPAKRFQAALMTDMEVDFEKDRQALPAPSMAALPAPGPKLDNFEALFGSGTTERKKVTVEADAGSRPHAMASSVAGSPPATDAAQRSSAPVAPGRGGDGKVGSSGEVPTSEPTGPSKADSVAPPATAGQDGPQDAGGAAHPPPASDPLPERVETALGEIAARAPDAVARMVQGKSYRAFVAELATAGRDDQVKRLADAVQQKAEEPTGAERLALADIAATATTTALGDLERNAAFKARVAALPPAARSRVHAATGAKYQSFAPGEDTP